jgi:hypothetical protein
VSPILAVAESADCSLDPVQAKVQLFTSVLMDSLTPASSIEYAK